MSKHLIVLALTLATVIGGAGPATASTSLYTMTDLGSLGYGVSYGLAINANGQITGYSYTSKEVQVSCPPHHYGGQNKCFIHPYHAFLWSNGTMTNTASALSAVTDTQPSNNSASVTVLVK